jgi:hypothetical protein
VTGQGHISTVRQVHAVEPPAQLLMGVFVVGNADNLFCNEPA